MAGTWDKTADLLLSGIVCVGAKSQRRTRRLNISAAAAQIRCRGLFRGISLIDGNAGRL